MTDDNKNTTASEKSEAKTITLRDAFDFVIYNWYWFVLSAIVFGCFGVIFALSLPNVFKAKAVIYVDDQYNRSMNPDISGGFMPGKMMSRNNNGVANELLIMKSRSIMENVVADLNANIVYSRKARLREDEVLTHNSPLVLIADSIICSYKLKIKVKENDSFEAVILYKPSGERKVVEERISGNFGQTFKNKVGIFSINKQADFKDIFEPVYDKQITISVNPVRKSAEKYSKLLEVSTAEKYSNIVNVAMTAHIPQKAPEMVNKLIAVYNQMAIDGKREMDNATRKFIEDRLAAVEIELSDVDSAIEKFKSSNSAIDIKSEAGYSIQSSMKYGEQLLETEIQLDMLKSIKDLLQKQKSAEPGLLPVNIGINDGSLANAIRDYNEIVLTKMRLSSVPNANNPVLRDLESQILSVQASLMQSIENVYSALKIKRQSLNDKIASISGKVSNLPYLEKETVAIERDQEIKATLYGFLLNKLENTQLSMVATAPVAKVIDPAITDENHISPNRSIIVLICLLIGLLFPALLIYLLEQLRTKVGRVGEVEDALHVPIIGAIPSKVQGMTDDKIVSPNSRDVITEAFRMVRTNLDFTMPVGGKVIMVTSSLPGDGKSFVSINLSLTLGIAGKKVLLVDLDLRKASLSEKISGHRQTRGLVNYLVHKNEESLDKLISHNAMHNVDVLYVGVIPPNPAELLIGDRITDTFEELKKIYDYIVVDTPPIGLVTDTMLINRIADLTIFSVRIGKSLKRNLPSLNVLSDNKTLRNMNIIITDTGAGRSYVRDSSNFGYGYGYGYGYGCQDDKKMNLVTRWKLWKKKIKTRKNKK